MRLTKIANIMRESNENNKHSSDMNERILKILTEVSQGLKTPKQARKELLGLFNVSVLLFDFWHHIRMHGDDTPKKEVKKGIADFLENYKR